MAGSWQSELYTYPGISGSQRCAALGLAVTLDGAQCVVALGQKVVKSMSERKRQPNVVGGRAVRREVTLTPVQDGQLTVAAERAGRSVPAFLVEAGLQAGGFQTETQRRESIFALFQLREQLARIGNNLNQMSRLLNTEGEVDADLRETLSVIRQKVKAVDSTVELFAAEREDA